MLKLQDYEAVFVAVGIVGVLLFAYPSLALVLRIPSRERFSELWLLGSGHWAEGYPFDVRADEDYLVYLGVGNHMGSPIYYRVNVKLGNRSDLLPSSSAGTPSSLPALYWYRVYLEEGKSWEAPITFSFSNVSFLEDRSMVGSLVINGFVVRVNKPALQENRAYYYQLFMELWIYDESLHASSSAFQFHNRSVGIWLNLNR